MRRGLACIFFVACGSNVADDFVPVDDAGVLDATTQADAIPFPEASTLDAPKFNGGGPFLCGDCICDGTLDLCYFGGGGGPMPIGNDAGDGGFGDASACVLDAGTACIQIPIACLPKPTCACVDAVYPSCACGIDPSGNGLVVLCPTHP